MTYENTYIPYYLRITGIIDEYSPPNTKNDDRKKEDRMLREWEKNNERIRKS